LPGGPTVLALCHPIKHVQDPDQLLPRGGSAFLNEVDGNLTLWRKPDDTLELSHTKLRGPGFTPIGIELETIEDAYRDSNDRPCKSIRARVLTAAEEELKEESITTDANLVLITMLSNPGLSVRKLAEKAGLSHGKVGPILTRLKNLKPRALLRQDLGGKYQLTDHGTTVAQKAASDRLQAHHRAMDRKAQNDLF
jgi:hypothetical protein